MQVAVIQAIYELAQADPRVMYVLSDSGCEYDRLFRDAFPSQYVDVGIAEQHLVTFAAGMALRGKVPFVLTNSPFLAYRAFESIRNDVCLQQLHVTFAAVGSGLSISALGPTHHGTEDIALMRVLPYLTLLSPATAEQALALTRAAYALPGPVYLRLGMKCTAQLPADADPLVVGAPQRLRSGHDAILFTTGSIFTEALLAAQALGEAGLSVGVYNVHTLAPLDDAACVRLSHTVRHVFTLEEHNIRGGLGGALCEALAGHAVPVTRLGLTDQFAHGYGSLDALRAQNGLDAPAIASRIRQAMEAHP